jgi:hypothetical protein
MMAPLRSRARVAWAPLVAIAAACAFRAAIAGTDADENGIYVATPKVYDDRTLQQQLLTLGSRLSQLSGLDQASLISRLGGLQGASSSQLQAGFQLLGTPSAGTATTAFSGTPSTVQTVGGATTSATPTTVQTNGSTFTNGTPQTVQTNGSQSTSSPGGSTTNAGTTTQNTTQTVTTTVSNTSGGTSTTVATTPGTTTANNNQTVTTTPSNTLQTVTTAPQITPAPAPLPSAPSFTLPSTFGVSSMDTLNEEMQLSYEMINLQLLLQGSLDDDYSVRGLKRRHVTLGFPINISTPKRYRNYIAEVEVSVCNPELTLEKSPATLQTILPREKTYNVASIVNKSIQLGAGAVIANVINFGGSFLYGHQTYYLVREQDTVALQRRPSRDDIKCPDNFEPVTFAWQFRPVLGQPTIQQGMRQTFAQIALAPSRPPKGDALPTGVWISTCWRKFDRKTGIAGDAASCIRRPRLDLPILFSTTSIENIVQSDNGDGSLTARVFGGFPVGTRVSIGDLYLTEATVGFENSGSFVRFTAANQLIGNRGARLLSPDGTEAEVELPEAFQAPYALTCPGFIAGDFPERTKVYVKGQGVGSFPSVQDSAPGIVFSAPNLADLATARLFDADGKPIGGYKEPVSFGCDLTISGSFAEGTSIEVGSDGERHQYFPEDYHSGPTAGGNIGMRFHFSHPAEVPQNLVDLEIVRPDSSHSHCRLPSAHPPAKQVNAIVAAYSDSQARVMVPLWQCREAQPEVAPNPLVAIVAGRVFGLSDAPFETSSDTQLTFLTPKTLLQGQSTLVLRRLFLGHNYEARYSIRPPEGAIVSMVSLLESSKSGTATFLVTGSQLSKAAFTYPGGLKPAVAKETYLWFSVPKAQLATLKQVVLASPGGPPNFVNLPAVTKPATDDSEKPITGISVLQSTKAESTFAITGNNLKDASVVFPIGAKVVDSGKSFMWITLSADQLSSVRQFVIQPKPAAEKGSTDNPPLVIAIPSLEKTDSTAKASLKPNLAGVPKGSTAPLKISGSSLQQIAQIRYLDVPVPYTRSADGTSVTITQVPSTLVANPGVAELEIRFADGTKQEYDVVINDSSGP